MGAQLRRVQAVDNQGRVVIAATDVGLRPGEQVVVQVLRDGSILVRRVRKRNREKGVVEAAAGMFKDRPEAAQAILSARDEEDRDV